MVAFYFSGLNANNKLQTPPSVSTKKHITASLNDAFADHTNELPFPFT